MDLALTPAQTVLQQEIRRLLEPHASPAATVRFAGEEPGYDPVLWHDLVGRGWLTTESAVDLAVTCEELGRVALPSPAHNGIVQTTAVLRTLGDQRAVQHIDAASTGRQRYALCVAEPDGGYSPGTLSLRADRDGGRWVLNGTKCFIPYARSADVFLIVARTGEAGSGSTPSDSGLSLFAVDARTRGVQTVPLDSIGGDRQCAIQLSDVEVDDTALVGPPGGSWPAVRRGLDRATVALCADMVGAAAAALDSTIERVSNRTQWGTALGAFQAVQHRCADMLIDVAIARDATFDAASTFDRGDDATYLISSAKSLCSEACRRVSASAHQLHGGEGIHADRAPHLWYRRIKSMESMLGGPRSHRARVAEQLLDEPTNEVSHQGFRTV